LTGRTMEGDKVLREKKGLRRELTPTKSTDTPLGDHTLARDDVLTDMRGPCGEGHEVIGENGSVLTPVDPFGTKPKAAYTSRTLRYSEEHLKRMPQQNLQRGAREGGVFTNRLPTTKLKG